jgi:hypothetical protein
MADADRATAQQDASRQKYVSSSLEGMKSDKMQKRRPTLLACVFILLLASTDAEGDRAQQQAGVGGTAAITVSGMLYIVSPYPLLGFRGEGDSLPTTRRLLSSSSPSHGTQVQQWQLVGSPGPNGKAAVYTLDLSLLGQTPRAFAPQAKVRWPPAASGCLCMDAVPLFPLASQLRRLDCVPPLALCRQPSLGTACLAACCA